MKLQFGVANTYLQYSLYSIKISFDDNLEFPNSNPLRILRGFQRTVNNFSYYDEFQSGFFPYRQYFRKNIVR